MRSKSDHILLKTSTPVRDVITRTPKNTLTDIAGKEYKRRYREINITSGSHSTNAISISVRKSIVLGNV